jgi:hypothetical protein
VSTGINLLPPDQADRLSGKKPSLPQAGVPQRATIPADTTTRAMYFFAEPGITKTAIPDRGWWLPVAPAEYTVQRTAAWVRQTVIRLGEVAHPTPPGLSTLTIDTLLPGNYDPQLCSALRDEQDFQQPGEWIDHFNGLLDNADVVRFTVGNRPSGNVSGRLGNLIYQLCFVSDFSWGEKAGQPFDRYISFTLTEWREQKQATVAGKKRPIQIPKTYRPKAQEDLRDVAQRWYGDVRRWKAIAALNNLKAPNPETPVSQLAEFKKPGTKVVLKLPRATGPMVAPPPPK